MTLPKITMREDRGEAVPLPRIFAEKYLYSESFLRANGVDESHLPPVGTQVDKECVAHAICRALEAEQAKSLGRQISLDSICYHRCIFNYGLNDPVNALDLIFSESDRKKAPFGASMPTDPRCEPQDRELLAYSAEKFVDIDDLKIWLSEGRPAVAIISVSDAFVGHGAGVYVENGNSNEIYQHCVAVIGFDEDSVRIQNSMGTLWGIDGRGWIDPDSCGLFGAAKSAVYRLN